MYHLNVMMSLVSLFNLLFLITFIKIIEGFNTQLSVCACTIKKDFAICDN